MPLPGLGGQGWPHVPSLCEPRGALLPTVHCFPINTTVTPRACPEDPQLASRRGRGGGQFPRAGRCVRGTGRSWAQSRGPQAPPWAVTGSEGWESGTALSPRGKVQTQPVLGRAQGRGGRVAGGEAAAGRARLEHRGFTYFTLC